MNLFGVFLIAVALALDAFGVALSIGLNKKVTNKMKVIFVLSFGGFQFLLSFLGSISGNIFTSLVTDIPNVVGGIIILIVGALMFRSGPEEDFVITKMIFLILGISVSIDALVVGFTVFGSGYTLTLQFYYTLIIGMVTVLLTTIAFFIAKKLSKIEIIEKYSEYLGGIILILFGLKMIFS